MSSASNKVGDEAAINRLPPSKEELSFKTFLWDPQNKSVLGRSGASWAKIVAFYMVFYTFLAAFFSIMMAVFYTTLNYDSPKFTGDESLLVNPGLGFRPRPHSREQFPAIYYDPSVNSTHEFYVKSIEKFMNPYASRPANAIDCPPGAGFRKEGDSACFFDVGALNTTCFSVKHWGYKTSSPCILFKLNRMFHWKPQPVESLEGLPEGLQQHINASENPTELLKQNVWVWCESEEIEMEQQSPGIPLSYFPFHNQDGYLAPFAPVRLFNLPRDRSVNVKCRVWAKNVKHRINLRYTGEVNIDVKVGE